MLSLEDKIEIEIIVNRRLEAIMNELLDDFGRFTDDVSARQLIETIKNKANKEAGRLKAQSAKTDLTLK